MNKIYEISSKMENIFELENQILKIMVILKSKHLKFTVLK